MVSPITAGRIAAQSVRRWISRVVAGSVDGGDDDRP
jgi:hypothetical protein